jgi:hypothetical protein
MLLAAQRLALAAVGGRVESPSKRKQLKARKSSKNAVRPHRQLHAVLGRSLGSVCHIHRFVCSPLSRPNRSTYGSLV